MGHFDPSGQWVEDQQSEQAQWGTPQSQPNPAGPPMAAPVQRQPAPAWQTNQPASQSAQQQNALGQTLVDQQNSVNRDTTGSDQKGNWDRFMEIMGGGKSSGQSPSQAVGAEEEQNGGLPGIGSIGSGQGGGNPFGV